MDHDHLASSMERAPFYAAARREGRQSPGNLLLAASARVGSCIPTATKSCLLTGSSDHDALLDLVKRNVAEA